MISWEIQDRVPSRVFYRGENVIRPWGFETSDSTSFFSLEEGAGWRYRMDRTKFKGDDRRFDADLDLSMRDGALSLSFRDRLEEKGTISRSVKAVCRQETYLLDFVLRFRFEARFFDWARIAGRTFFHRSTNIYHEFPASEVFLKWKGSKGGVRIRVTRKVVPPNMTPVMYVRDANGEWVVHLRMLSVRADRRVIKLCNRFFQTRPLPGSLTDFILSRPKWEKALLRRGERAPFQDLFFRRLNPNAYWLARLPKGQKLQWDARVTFDRGV